MHNITTYNPAGSSQEGRARRVLDRVGSFPKPHFNAVIGRIDRVIEGYSSKGCIVRHGKSAREY